MSALIELPALAKGSRVQFVYHGKERIGTIDDVRQTSCIVKLDAPEDGTQYKGFSYRKMERFRIVN